MALVYDPLLAEQALTDNVDETWHAGRHASPNSPVFIDLDLRESTYIDRVELLPYQAILARHSHGRLHGIHAFLHAAGANPGPDAASTLR
jgi:hypothetical protein